MGCMYVVVFSKRKFPEPSMWFSYCVLSFNFARPDGLRLSENIMIQHSVEEFSVSLFSVMPLAAPALVLLRRPLFDSAASGNVYIYNVYGSRLSLAAGAPAA